MSVEQRVDVTRSAAASGEPRILADPCRKARPHLRREEKSVVAHCRVVVEQVAAIEQ